MFSLQRIRRNKTRGFTLIEVLIALAVFAAVGITLAKNASTVVLQTNRMEERALAWSVASNVANDRFIRTEDESPIERTGRRTQEVLQANRSWFVETALRSTDNDDLKVLTVSVSDADTPEDVLVTLNTFVGRH